MALIDNDTFMPLEVPAFWQDRVCLRYPHHSVMIWHNNLIPLCSADKKPLPHLLHYCGLCEEVFLRDFRHPAWDVVRRKWCWPCLEAEAPDVINDGSSMPISLRNQTDKVKIPPMLSHLYAPKVRKYSDEELDALFD